MDSLKLIVASLFANVAGLLFPIKDDADEETEEKEDGAHDA